MTQFTKQADNILGLVSRAGTAEWFTQHIPVYPQAPMFEAFLGRCIIHNFVGRWKDPHDERNEQYFSVGWKFRRDGRINEALHRLYPPYPFSIDIVVMQFGDGGTIVPLSRMIDRTRAYKVIREYVIPRDWPYLAPDLNDAMTRFLEDLHNRLLIMLRHR